MRTSTIDVKLWNPAKNYSQNAKLLKCTETYARVLKRKFNLEVYKKDSKPKYCIALKLIEPSAKGCNRYGPAWDEASILI